MARHTIDESIKEVTFDFKYNKKQFDALMTPATEVLFGGAKGSGKLLDLNTDIITTYGWKKIRDVHPGDYVFDENGEPTLVVAEVEEISEDSYEIIFGRNRTSLICDKNHKWVTINCGLKNFSMRKYGYIKDKYHKVHTTQEILDTLKFSTSNQSNHSIKKASPLVYTEKDLLIDPYVLGLWLGDGHSCGGGYTCNDLSIIEEIKKIGYTVTKHKSNKYRYTIWGLITELRSLNLLQNKHIPTIYKTASVDQRLALCQGLMDSDGSIEAGKRLGTCIFSSSLHPLAEDVLELFVGLGLKPSNYTREAWLNEERKRDRTIIKFKTTLPVFRLPRKLERIPEKVNIANDYWSITDIKKVESRPMKCIQVASKSHMYLAGKNLIPTHNSYLARQAAVTYAFNIPGLQVYIFRESYSEVKRNYLYGADGLEAILKQAEKAGLCSINSSEPRIHFYNGSDIYLRHMNTAQDVEQIRGNDVHVLIADEAAQWLIRDIYNQLRTCMRCSLEIDYDHLAKIGMDFVKPGFFPRALLLSNPGGVAHTFIRDEFITNMPPNTPVQMEDEDGGMIREFIPAFLSDNSILLKRDPKYRAKLLGSGKHVRAMLEGDWNGAEGSALYDEWDTRYNLMAPFKVPSNARIKRCFDWGIAKPYAATYVWETRNDPVDIGNGIVKVFPAGTMIVVGEKYGWNGRADEGCKKTAKEVGAELKKYEMLQPWCQQIMQGPSDGSIFNATHNDKTINDEIVWGFNHYSDGTRTSTYYRESLFIRADRSKGSRAKGLALVKSYLRSAHDQEINGEFYPSEEPGLIFFTTCVRCIATLPSLPFDKNDPDDIDTKSEDHLYDTIRYAVLGKTESFTPLTIQGI